MKEKIVGERASELRVTFGKLKRVNYSIAKVKTIRSDLHLAYTFIGEQLLNPQLAV